ncbi:MAG: SUMF1/EgtB/PvdO family nonheme iron enzyme [bacterium]|nr:SUMF1/EgtB/PvdO family nonheme iron enzyme [bacterium]
MIPSPAIFGSGHKGASRVVRGGSWNNSAHNVRAAIRNSNDQGNRNDNLGFRLARAQTWTGWSAPDPTTARSASSRGGECVPRTGVLVVPPEAARKLTGAFSFLAARGAWR